METGFTSNLKTWIYLETEGVYFMSWFECSENQMVRETLSGYEFIQAIWLDTCPYDSNREYCVIQAEIEFNDEVTDLESASNYFDEYCINDSHVVKEDCSKEEALQFIEEWTNTH